jgi:hypothetical protein
LFTETGSNGTVTSPLDPPELARYGMVTLALPGVTEVAPAGVAARVVSPITTGREVRPAIHREN